MNSVTSPAFADELEENDLIRFNDGEFEVLSILHSYPDQVRIEWSDGTDGVFRLYHRFTKVRHVPE